MAMCIQCEKMNLQKTNEYGEAFCEDKDRYYDPYSGACSNIVFSDSSLRNREDEYEKGNSSSCYLTTAMCDVLRYDDNCYYLKVLRNFRDNYMMNNRNYFNLLIEYEVIGPIISKYILKDKETAQIMLDDYISKTIMFIQKKDYKRAINIYIEMVEFLKEKYNMTNLIIDNSNLSFQPNLNKHMIRTLAKEATIIRK